MSERQSQNTEKKESGKPSQGYTSRGESSTAGSKSPALSSTGQPHDGAQSGHKPAGGRKSLKDMTKAERRALQEQKVQEKQNRMAAGLPGSAKKASEQEAHKKVGSPKIGSTSNSAQPIAPDAGKQAKKQQNKLNQVPWLSHLDPPKKPNTGSNTNRELHPAVLALGLRFAEHKMVGSNARCVAMLTTFAKIIRDHKPPSDASFSRHIQKYLDPHIAYLLSVRPMSLSMRECIRWLKKEISEIVEEDPPLTDESARNRLVERIEHFIKERITMADTLIVENGMQKIQNGDVILTYAKSSVVEALLLEAKRSGYEFRVIVVDSRPMFEGKHLLRRLVSAGIECSYVLLSSLYVVLNTVTKVILGAHALLNNGAVYSRIGTAMVAMAASDKQIPVIVCCETYKFVNRTQVDSLVLNEMGNADELVEKSSVQSSSNPLSNWRDLPNLRLLNLLYDVTPSKHITLVVTEVGLIPCTSAPVIWREYK
ncbi:unnamed protein product [Umbelopsis sp. WA50703]